MAYDRGRTHKACINGAKCNKYTVHYIPLQLPTNWHVGMSLNHLYMP